MPRFGKALLVVELNLPVGEIIEKRSSLADVDVESKLVELLKSDFNGYMVVTGEGPAGIEEGVLLIAKQQIVAALFEAVKFKKQFSGVPGLRLALNLARAKKGVFDVDKLSRQQVDLIMAFNEKAQLVQPVDWQTLIRLIPSAYNPELILQALQVDLKGKVPRDVILSRFGLGSIK